MADLEDTADDETPARVTLFDYVEGVPGDEAYIAQCEIEAAGLVDNYIGEAAAPRVPEASRRRAILEVGSDLYNRRSSRNGVIGFDSGDFAAPVRIARDPMISAYPILRQYLPVGLA